MGTTTTTTTSTTTSTTTTASSTRTTANKICRSGETCIDQEKCPKFLNLKEQWRNTAKGTFQRSRLLQRLQSSICQKITKYVCCAVPSRTTTTTTTTTTVTTANNLCRSGETCISRDKCPRFLDLREQWRRTAKGSAGYNSLLQNIRGMICQK